MVRDINGVISNTGLHLTCLVLKKIHLAGTWPEMLHGNLCCEDDYGAEQDKVHERERARRPWLVPPMGELALDNK